jgi:hypothetical protein
MRKFLVAVGLVALLVGSVPEANAQRAFSNKELNERIKALRTRLADYQQKSVRKVIDRTPLANESIAITTEKAFVELDSRKDAAVTVLFHDNEFQGNSAALPATRQSVLPIAAGTDGKLLAEGEEKRLRNEKFAALRQKVQMATRRTHNEAVVINSQMAKLQ